jgi:tetratricopeptide (TPR) repeat protein
MMRVLIPAALLVLTAAPAAAQSFDCPTLYDEGSYAAAGDCFEQLGQQGHHNGHVLYNLGNSRYREGALGDALVAWRRAELYIPRDADLKANLKRGRDQARDDLAPAGQRGALARTLLGPYDALTSSELLLLGALAWALLLLVLGIRLSRPVPGWQGVAAVLALLVLFGLGGWSVRSYSISEHPAAVILADEVTLRSGRDVLSTDLARLH